MKGLSSLPKVPLLHLTLSQPEIPEATSFTTQQVACCKHRHTRTSVWGFSMSLSSVAMLKS